MSKADAYRNMTNTPPPYEPPPPQHGQGMATFPQSDPGYGYDQGPRQSQTNVINVQPGGVQPQTIVVTATEPIPSMSAHITLSCFVFWCCSPLFGCIAFFIAIAGTSANSPAEARSMGKASLGVNIAGIIISVIIAAIIIGLYAAGKFNGYYNNVDNFNDNYNFEG